MVKVCSHHYPLSSIDTHSNANKLTLSF
jgi:hypothetical protein